MEHNLNDQNKEACVYVLYSINFSVPRCKNRYVDRFDALLPRRDKTKRKTPWAAGCCGPKFKLNYLFYLN